MDVSVRSKVDPLTPCHVCGGPTAIVSQNYRRLKTVASDCKPSIDGLTLLVCSDCGHTQKSLDERWQAACDAIYGGYDLYHQSGGGEQVIFDAGGGSAAPRSLRLVNQLRELGFVKPRGRLLDVGCGNGAMLQSFSQLCPEWRLEASELNDRFRKRVLSIPGVTAFHCATPDRIDGRFDLVTLLHVLEHIPDPVAVLRSLQQRLTDNGAVFVQVPYLRENPFDLLVVDHCSHFVPEVLRWIAGRAGYSVAALATDWIAKEISLVLRPAGKPNDVAANGGAAPGSNSGESCAAYSAAEALSQAAEHVEWLSGVVAESTALSARGELGIFGTSIAGTWLGTQIGEAASFFVDEDLSRVGGRHLDKPILAPAEVPAGSYVYLALPAAIASRVCERLQPAYPEVKFVPPHSELVSA